jgi:hypothetical protein
MEWRGGAACATQRRGKTLSEEDEKTESEKKL